MKSDSLFTTYHVSYSYIKSVSHLFRVRKIAICYTKAPWETPSPLSNQFDRVSSASANSRCRAKARLKKEVCSDFSSRLLTPIGHHRIAYMAPSKGKRKRKRKRLEAKSMDSNFGLEKDNLSPPAPELSSHLLIGLASITRHLEILTRNQRWKWTEDKSHTNLLRSSNEIDHDSLHNSEMKVRHLAAIFVCRSSQPSVLHSHLPQLVTTTSLTQPYLQQTRLVQLPQGCESGLSSSLGLSCASFVGIFEDAPHSKLLVDFVRDVVPIIEVPWLKEAQKAQYMPVKVNAILTTAPLLKSNQKRS